MEYQKEIIEKAANQVSNFFNDEIPRFKVYFLKSRDEMDKLWNKKTPAWLVAKAGENREIHIFDKEIFDRVSPHPKNDFEKVLIHEITHIYTKEKFNLTFPMWLNEGIAYVVASQDKKEGNKKDISKMHTFDEWNENPSYGSSGKFVRFLLNKFGKDRLLNLLKRIEKNEKKEKFNEKFREIYGYELNNLIQTWQKNSAT